MLRHLLSSLVLLLCAAVLCPSIQAQVVVQAHLDTASILIGQQVQLHVTCNVRPGQRVTFPYYQQGEMLTQGIEVVNNGPIDTLRTDGGQRLILRRDYAITSFDSALYSLPPIAITVDGRRYASRGNIGLKVSTVAVDTVHVDRFKGPHAAIDMPFRWSWLPTGLALLAILSTLGTLALSIRRADPKLITRRVVIMPPTPAHVTALKTIDEVKRQTQTDTKSYYTQLTGALRTYLSERFGFDAREMTTQEILDQLYALGHEDALIELRDILLTADLVKFAKHTVSQSDQDRNLLQAMDYVKSTKYVPPIAPKPRVEYVALGGRAQRGLRLAMTLGAVLCGTAAVGLTCTVLGLLYCCFA